jgi:CIC family chloride channel protein
MFRVRNGDKPRLLLDSLVLGIIGGLSAQVFTWMLRASQKVFLGWIAGYTPPAVSTDGGVLRQVIGPHGLLLIPFVTTLGGLISGALVYGLAPETEGHGTDTVVKALHFTGGTLRARVAPIKMLASAITIGSGGSAGREGPTALIAAGFGSIYATWLKRSERERRLIVMMGMAAGLSAIFRSPIGTAIFAVEVLYSGIEFESEGLLYCMLAAIVAYAVNGAFVGWQPLFQVPTLSAPNTGCKLWMVRSTRRGEWHRRYAPAGTFLPDPRRLPRAAHPGVAEACAGRPASRSNRTTPAAGVGRRLRLDSASY